MTASKRAIATDLKRLDAHKVSPGEYEEIPELTDEFSRRPSSASAIGSCGAAGPLSMRPSGSSHFGSIRM